MQFTFFVMTDTKLTHSNKSQYHPINKKVYSPYQIRAKLR